MVPLYVYTQTIEVLSLWTMINIDIDFKLLYFTFVLYKKKKTHSLLFMLLYFIFINIIYI